MDIGLKPLFTRIIIKRKVPEKIGRILVPQTSQEARVGAGEVVAVGPDCEVAKVGDVVLFGRYAPYLLNKQELEWAGIFLPKGEEEYMLCNEEDLLAIRKEKMNG